MGSTYVFLFLTPGEENKVVHGMGRNISDDTTDNTMYHYRAFRPARSSITHVQVLIIFWVMGKFLEIPFNASVNGWRIYPVTR